MIVVTDQIILPTYLLIISSAFSLALFWVLYRTKKSELSSSFALDLCLVIMVFGFIGARLFHVVYEEPIYYLQNPLAVLKVWQGGFVYYGGAISAFFAGLLYTNWRKENVGQWADLMAPVAAGGYALGRLGCFFNGCCYGEICHWPWGVQFPHLEGLRHPTQLYAALIELGIAIFLLQIERRRPRWLKSGGVFLFWIMLHALNRMFMEAFRADPRGTELLGWSISSLISLGLLIEAARRLYKMKQP